MRWLRDRLERDGRWARLGRLRLIRWTADHLDAVLIVLTCALMLSGVYAAGEYQARQRVHDQAVRDARELEERIGACERGNVIRRAQRLDNVIAIKSGLKTMRDPVTTDAAKKRAAESVQARRSISALIEDFPCQTLREERR